jgi:hypothetical protein
MISSRPNVSAFARHTAIWLVNEHFPKADSKDIQRYLTSHSGIDVSRFTNEVCEYAAWLTWLRE